MGFGQVRFFREFPGICGVFQRRAIFSQNSGNLWGFMVCRGILVKIPVISGVLVRRGDFRFFPGNCAVSVFSRISNCVFVDLRGLRWFGLSSMIVIRSEET